MNPTPDYRQALLAGALQGWAEQLAAGRPWGDVEGEILACCHGRIDLMAGLLIHAETLRGNGGTATQEAYGACA